MMKPDALSPVSEYLSSGEVQDIESFYGIDIAKEDFKPKKNVVVKSSEDSRKSFFKERDEQFKSKKRR